MGASQPEDRHRDRDRDRERIVSLLNLTCSEFFSAAERGSSLVWMTMPWLRAVGGRLVRKSRADLEWAEKGLILVLTSVMKRVIILGGLDTGEGVEEIGNVMSSVPSFQGLYRESFPVSWICYGGRSVAPVPPQLRSSALKKSRWALPVALLACPPAAGSSGHPYCYVLCTWVCTLVYPPGAMGNIHRALCGR